MIECWNSCPRPDEYDDDDYWLWYYSQYIRSMVWKRKKEAVRKRCDNVCEKCNEKHVSVVHHLTYARLGREYLSDLLGVCHDCHHELHRRSGIHVAVRKNIFVSRLREEYCECRYKIRPEDLPERDIPSFKSAADATIIRHLSKILDLSASSDSEIQIIVDSMR